MSTPNQQPTPERPIAQAAECQSRRRSMDPRLPSELIALVAETYFDMRAHSLVEDKGRTPFPILPLLATSRLIYSLLIPCLYAHPRLSSLDTITRFLREPSPYSYRHIKTLEAPRPDVYEGDIKREWRKTREGLVDELRERLVDTSLKDRIPVKELCPLEAELVFEDGCVMPMRVAYVLHFKTVRLPISRIPFLSTIHLHHLRTETLIRRASRIPPIQLHVTAASTSNDDNLLRSIVMILPLGEWNLVIERKVEEVSQEWFGALTALGERPEAMPVVECLREILVKDQRCRVKFVSGDGRHVFCREVARHPRVEFAGVCGDQDCTVEKSQLERALVSCLAFGDRTTKEELAETLNECRVDVGLPRNLVIP